MRASTITAFLLLAAPTRTALPHGLGSAQFAQEVLSAEDARFAAMIRADTAALAGMLADDLLYVHSNSRTETKAQFLMAVGSQAIRYLAFVPVERRVAFLDTSAALIMGRANARVLGQGAPLPVVGTLR
ncbi:MAG: nuclear transport factor 2 family protein [Mycobacterium sp.]